MAKLGPVDKELIIREIQRTARANGGKPLGRLRFTQETGISYNAWYGVYWVKWSDALREAGLAPNDLARRIDDRILLQGLIQLTRKLGHVPTHGELLIAIRQDESLPSEKVYRRLGDKRQRAMKVVEMCNGMPGYDDVANLWSAVNRAPAHIADEEGDGELDVIACGYVYLLKHGRRREYKIGRTANPLRREGEVSIQLPEMLHPVHYIKTDDPAGVEAYWHTRFACKRKEGEWFALSSSDVRAFKRWRRIY